MSERQTQKLTTPGGKEVEVKTYFTARERNELRNVLLQGVAVDTLTGQPKVGELNGELLEKLEHKSIQIAVASYDGSAENVLERVLDGSPEDYDFIVAEANKAANFKPAK